MKKWFRLRWMIPAVIVLFFSAVFCGWYLLPSKKLNIVLINKTVPASKVDAYNNTAGDYRKHIGFYWLLNEQKYISSLTDQPYDYKTDYYGSMLDDTKTVSMRNLERLETTPDLLYITDTYGDENNADTSVKGLSLTDMGVIATAHNNGTTLVGESDIASSTTEDSVIEEIQALFGFTYSHWTGRYIYDMQDLTDIPEWALSLHEQQYGRQWDYTGSGILLVSKQGELVILQGNTDFDSKNLLSVSVTKPYQSQFGSHKLNFYNWFELIEADYGTDVVAQFNFDLNAAGKEKFSKISNRTTFAAITKKDYTSAPAYYFAGDFNDYVTRERYAKFLFSDSVYRLFSYDRPGDITNFYWSFYFPLMQNVLKEVSANQSQVIQPQTNQAASVKIENHQFSVLVDGTWTPIAINGLNINAVMPGVSSTDHTRDIAIYTQYLDEVASMGGNCVRVYDLMPPEFYRAISEFNRANPDKPIYFMQSIVPPSSVTAADYAGDAPQSEMRRNIEQVIHAVHGKGTVATAGVYINDVSRYLAGYIVEMDSTEMAVKALNAKSPTYTYTGTYVSGDVTPAEAVLASLCDYVYTYQLAAYGYLTPVGAAGNASLLPSVVWSTADGVKLDVSRLSVSDMVKSSFFVTYSLQPTDRILLDNTVLFSTYSDSEGVFPYGGYVQAVMKAQTTYPVLIDRCGLSTNTNAFDAEGSVNGLSETEQGNGIVRMLKAIRAQGCLGGLISDLDDNWSACSEAMKAYTISLKDNPLWLNTLDAAQTTGLLAVEPIQPNEIGMSLKDTGRMSELQISSNEAYLYATVLFNTEVDYDNEQLIIGLDTYQRNNGEYLYDSAYYATSLSGMEFIIKFESKNSAGLYVIPGYNRNQGQFSSKESYNGQYTFIAQLTYGTFEYANTNFYQTGSTLRIRIPWSALNFTDPVKKLVINDTRSADQIAQDAFGIQTTATDGILVSLLIANKETKDTSYIFPVSKQDSGYKLFKWDKWETPTYKIRQKGSCNILEDFFTNK